jgi:hypothetical protein
MRACSRRRNLARSQTLSAVKSTSPNCARITASSNSPVVGLPVRENATASCMPKREFPGAAFSCSRTCSFLGLAGREIAIVIAIEGDNDKIGHRHWEFLRRRSNQKLLSHLRQSRIKQYPPLLILWFCAQHSTGFGNSAEARPSAPTRLIRQRREKVLVVVVLGIESGVVNGSAYLPTSPTPPTSKMTWPCDWAARGKRVATECYVKTWRLQGPRILLSRKNRYFRRNPCGQINQQLQRNFPAPRLH